MIEHDYEPVRGLPFPLPKGETILWQGAPLWRSFARRAMRVRIIAGYFVLLAAWGVIGRLSSGAPVSEVAISILRLAALAAVALGLLALFAWLVARTTLYTITTRRVVMRFGIALPITIQMSFRVIESAGMHIWPDGTGDIAVRLMPEQRISYLIVWPHVRPWKLANAQPTLRAIPQVDVVARILGRELAASAAQPAKVIATPILNATSTGSHIPAAA